MNITANVAAANANSLSLLKDRAPAPPALDPAAKASPELREAFTAFVGETFYNQLLGSMRKTVEKPAYFHGGRAEEVFQGQLDQTLAEDMTKATSDQFAGPMFDLFMLGRPT
jgi:Rod binding domain-containing protein